MEEQANTVWENLSSDLSELIFSYLPIPSVIRASAVCKLWRSLITNPSFSSRFSASKNKPWFFLYGLNNIFPKNNQAFAFDPDSHQWIRLPTTLFPRLSHHESFVGSGGYLFVSTTSRFSYTPLLRGSWIETLPLRFSRSNPLVGVFEDGSGSIRFIVVGGVRFIGGLVDLEDPLAVEIYDLRTNSWDLCPPLPAEFSSANSSQWLSSALFKGKFYVFGIFSCFVSAFDLRCRIWSEVRTVRPSGIVFSFLISCSEQLVLAGVRNGSNGSSSFNLWIVDDGTMELSEIGEMPQELLHCLFDGEEEDRFASLKCVGLGNLVYVFNQEHHKRYPSCVCEIDQVSFKCSWSKIPDLPVPVNQFHKVISFCSTVLLGNVLQGE